jgi:hypothetical protein
MNTVYIATLDGEPVIATLSEETLQKDLDDFNGSKPIYNHKIVYDGPKLAIAHELIRIVKYEFFYKGKREENEYKIWNIKFRNS